MIYENTKNLFNYATKELSQDALLRWLFENYNCDYKDVREASIKLLQMFIGKSIEASNVKKLKTFAQLHKMDIVVTFELDSKKHVIVIEDKTDSSEHGNQLGKYKEKAEHNFANSSLNFIYYKTNLLSNYEATNIMSKGWKIFDIAKIQNIFSTLHETEEHQLLKDYKTYINQLYEDLTGRLSDDISEWNFNHWTNFCINHTPKAPKGYHFGFGNFRGNYINVWFNKNSSGTLKYPYAEVISRDFNSRKYKNKFQLRVLLHGIDPKIVDENVDKWKKNLKKSDLLIVRNLPKQIAKNKTYEKIHSLQELQKVFQKYIDEYAKIMV